MTRLAIAIVVVLAARTAAAYPQFQLQSGTVHCAQCHLSPSGGGLLTQWGQTEAADTISRGGDGRFLHGAIELPDWLAIGGDARVAALANDVGDSNGTELAAFPMQADLAARLGSGAFSVIGTVGARGAVRSGAPTSTASDASTVMAPSLGTYLVSREHYAMYKPGDDGVYVRAGRFAAPYGLRLADHTAYVRRYLGYNLMEETYGLGAGFLGGTWEAHATAFVSDPLQGVTRKEVGGAMLIEKEADIVIVGLSTRAGIGSEDTRLQAGVHTKLWLEAANLLLQAEVDGVRQKFDAGTQQYQLAAYAGPVWIPTKGVYSGVAYEAFAEDLHVRGTTRHALDAYVSVFPRAHWELMASGRAQRIGVSEHAYLAMLQVHYTL